MTELNFCCLCASDEGVFLDIFTSTNHQLGNRSFLKEFETCLSFKVKENDAPSSKICHKCAIELGECNRFIERYRKTSTNSKAKTSKSLLRRSCCLCHTAAKNKCLFTLAKDFRSTIDCLEKIYECFKLQINREEAEGKLICLLCRYNLDVLYDLKKLAREVPTKLEIIAKSKAIVANLPKTETFVVSRKTTVIRHPRIELLTPVQCDSEYGTMARRQLRSKKSQVDQTPAVESKPRICGQCETSIGGGTDMYRLHKTGVTVCKMCWITMDPLKTTTKTTTTTTTTTKGNKRKRKNEPESKNTKLCAVFLKDVLSSPSTKVDAVPKVEKDDVIYISSDDSWEEKKLAGNGARKSLRRRWGDKSTKSDQEIDRRSEKQGVKRPLKLEDGQKEDKKNKKLKSVKNIDANIAKDGRRITRAHNSDSEIVVAAMKMKNDSTAGESRGSDKPDKIHPGDKLGKKKVDKKKLAKEKKGEAEKEEEEEDKSKSEDLSSADDGGVGKKLRKVRNKVKLALKSESVKDEDLSPKLDESRKNLRSRKSSVVVSKPNSKSPAAGVKKTKPHTDVADKSNSTTKTKVNQKRSKTVMMVSFPFKLKDPYECKVCGTVYRNKIVGMKHELTHFKQIEIKIEKLNINHHFQTDNETSPPGEISQEPDRDEGSFNLSQTNEKPTESLHEDSPDKVNDDDGNQSEDKTPAETEDSFPNTNGLKFSQQDDARTSDVEDTKESDAVEATEQPTPEESTVATNAPKDVAPTEQTASEPSLENEESPNPKEDAVSKNVATDKETESDLPAEINAENEDKKSDDKEEASEILKEDEIKEPVEKVTDEKNTVEEKVLPAERNETEQRGDSGEEMESDTDIRIVDPGSSADEGSDQSEKKEDNNAEDPGDVLISKGDVEDVKKVSDGESADADKSKSVSDDESESITASQKEPVSEEKSADANPENGEEDKESEDKVENRSNERVAESQDKKVEDVNGEDVVSTTSAVSEILQEVIDLASAEVQKRTEVEESAAETLEDISNEINKSGLENLNNIESKTKKSKGCDEGETDMTLNDLYE